MGGKGSGRKRKNRVGRPIENAKLKLEKELLHEQIKYYKRLNFKLKWDRLL